MIDIARKIRAQLAGAPNRKTFRKSRATLLEIAVALECAHKALADTDATTLPAARPSTKQGATP